MAFHAPRTHPCPALGQGGCHAHDPARGIPQVERGAAPGHPAPVGLHGHVGGGGGAHPRPGDGQDGGGGPGWAACAGGGARPPEGGPGAPAPGHGLLLRGPGRGVGVHPRLPRLRARRHAALRQPLRPGRLRGAAPGGGHGDRLQRRQPHRSGPHGLQGLRAPDPAPARGDVAPIATVSSDGWNENDCPGHSLEPAARRILEKTD